jgi:flagellar basal body P-ring formation protein FlgA
MRQAANSLLTLRPIFTKQEPSVCLNLRRCLRIDGSSLIYFHPYQEGSARISRPLLGLSRPPRNMFRPRSGEGSICSSAVLICLLLVSIRLLSTNAFAGVSGDTIVALKNGAWIHASEVSISDVAELSGSDQRRIDELRKVSLGPAPEVSVVRNFGRDEIRRAIETSTGRSSDLNFRGAASVRVRSTASAAELEDLTPVIRAFIASVTAWQESQIDIVSISNLKTIELPHADVKFRIPPKTPLLSLKNALLPIEVIVDGSPYQLFWLTADIRIRANIVVAARKIPYGKTLSADDVVFTQGEVINPHAAYETNCESVIGKISRRNIAAGESFTRELLENPYLVHSGQTVQVHLRRNGIDLAAIARAEQDGKLGQVIRVRNLDFSHMLKAQVVGPGEVKVD